MRKYFWYGLGLLGVVLIGAFWFIGFFGGASDAGLVPIDQLPAGFLPDGISMAKSLGGGFPIGTFWVRAPYADLLGAGVEKPQLLFRVCFAANRPEGRFFYF